METEWFCVVPGCNTKTIEKIGFQFPKNNEILFKKWIQNLKSSTGIPDFVVSSETKICEDHFEYIDKQTDSTGKCIGLTEDAAPSIFSLESDICGDFEFPKDFFNSNESLDSCRFCLSRFNERTRVEINNEIELDFKNLTHMELNLSSNYSQQICLSCHKNLKFSTKFKSKLIAIQLKLTANSEDISNSILDIKSENDISDLHFERVEVKIENDSDSDCKKDEFSLFGNLYTDIPDLENNGNGSSQLDHHIQEIKKESTKRLQKRSKGRKKNISFDAEWANEKVLCQDCGKILRQASLKLHIDRRHLGKKGDYCCDVCGYQTHTKNNLKYHMVIHNKRRDFPCKECGKMFPTPGSVTSHRKSVHLNDGPPKFVCEYCQKGFKIKLKMIDHVKMVHLKEKRFVCEHPGCGMTFAVRTTFYHHRNVHNGVMFPCDMCDSKFYLKKKLKEHQNRHTKPFKCEICGEGFFSRAQLEYHQKFIHKGIKEFPCPHCEKMYPRKNYLDRHIESIHMRIKVPCEIPSCKSQFARKETYRKHVLSHHQDLGEEQIQALLYKIRHMRVADLAH